MSPSTYTFDVPKLWNDTIEEHRRAVRNATIETTASLVAEQGLRSVTMSQIAEETGIGRATLYKYFPDVDSILRAWHERQIKEHLEYLAEVRDKAAEPGERLALVVDAFAAISYESRDHRDSELAALLHQDDHVPRAQQHLHKLIRDLVAEAVRSGNVRDDVPPAELATYCIHALIGAAALPSHAAVRRLVEVTMDGLRPQGR